ncbi:MAG TPA: hypothetical protein VMQ11_02020 [Alphaproteobacteria bacterium]|nr:hypothetical protein [Alphaproteobacteria bacterium]
MKIAEMKMPFRQTRLQIEGALQQGLGRIEGSLGVRDQAEMDERRRVAGIDREDLAVQALGVVEAPGTVRLNPLLQQRLRGGRA